LSQLQLTKYGQFCSLRRPPRSAGVSRAFLSGTTFSPHVVHIAQTPDNFSDQDDLVVLDLKEMNRQVTFCHAQGVTPLECAEGETVRPLGACLSFAGGQCKWSTQRRVTRWLD
jgi:hypothetical protein